LSYMEQVKAMSEPVLAADPNDARAATDLMPILENEAECYEDRAAGIFTAEPANPAADAASALQTLSEARSLIEHLLQVEPGSVHLRATLGLILIRMSLQQRALHRTEGTVELAARGVAMLKAVGKQPNAQGFDLDAVATGLTTVIPERLRDPQLAVEYAERIVDRSHRRKPEYLLTLAQAYRAAGQPEKARVAAREGLALYPAATPATVPSRVRKQLQAELAE